MSRTPLLHPALLALALVAGAGPACAAEATWSEVTGALAGPLEASRAPTAIVRVDGKPQRDALVRIAPGRRMLVVRAPARRNVPASEATYELDVTPCKRYFINAQFRSDAGREWDPVVVRIDDIAACRRPPL